MRCLFWCWCRQQGTEDENELWGEGHWFRWENPEKWSQALLGDAKRKDGCKLWPVEFQLGIRKEIHCQDGHWPKGPRSGGISFLRDIQDLAGWSPGQPHLNLLCFKGCWTRDFRKGSFQPKLFCDPMNKTCLGMTPARPRDTVLVLMVKDVHNWRTSGNICLSVLLVDTSH